MRRAVVALVGVLLLLAGCAPAPATATAHDRLRVVTTTGILADLARNVGGEYVEVTSLVPEGGDPHSYEPRLRDIRDIVYTDVAFTNYLMLEEQRLISAIDANLPNTAANVSLAEKSVQYAANIIPLVEDASLDTVWLGLRAEGGDELSRDARVEFAAAGLDGPGDLHAYLTGSFGEVEQYFDSTNGMHADAEDTASLPPNAHTHLSWAFTQPGIYRLQLRAGLQGQPLTAGTVTFAVGVDPYSVRPGARVLDSGHADIDVNLADGSLRILHDTNDTREYLSLEDVVVSVPNTALHEVPPGPAWRFLGGAGTQVYQLAQAVLGKHVHGEIDPHLWHDVHNAQAYAQIMRDTFIARDPQHAAAYTRQTRDYLAQLDALDAEVRDTIGQIPESRRTLITTHDSFGYLAAAYGLRVAGFVTPNPAVEPSLAQRRKLAETIRNLQVPAVFLEPNLAEQSKTLREIANDAGIRVCPILGDSFTATTHTYIDFMRFNANSLRDCLTEQRTNTP